MVLNCGVGKDSWESLAKRSKQSILKEISPGCSLEGLMLKLKLYTLVTWCEELTHWKGSWYWERMREGGEGDDRGWDSWMATPVQWTWASVDSRSWWWTGRPGVLQFLGSQRVGHNWATELNWSEWYFAEVQPQQDQEYPRDEWHRRGRRQTHRHRRLGRRGSFFFFFNF